MSDNTVQITVRVNDQTARGFRDVNGRLRDLQGRFAAAAGDIQRSSAGLTGSLSSASSGLMSLKGAGIGAAAALGTSLLPAVGALAPMLSGVAVVGGGAALAMDDLKEKAKQLKPAFEDWKTATEKAIAPHTERAVKDLKVAMKELQPSLVLGAETFGTITERAAKFAASPAFQSAFQKNAQMGVVFVEQMAVSVGKFAQSFLEFGTKSGPALDAFQRLFGGLLDTGLPGMFKGLEVGVKGASQVLDGLAYMLNDKLLPAFGRFSGEFARATGPLFEQGFKLLGDVGGAALETLSGGLRVAGPLLRDLAEGLRAMRTIAEPIAETMAGVGRVLADALIPGDLGEGPLKRLADAIDRNKGAIQEAARIMGATIISMVQVGVSSLPLLVAGFRSMTSGILTALDGVVSGAAAAFGWVPGIGEKLRGANTAFDQFASDFRGALGRAQEKANEFAASTSEKLSAGKLRLDISNWEAQVRTAKEQLKSVPPGKRADLKARIADLEAKIRRARELLNGLDGTTANTYVNNIITTVRRERAEANTIGRPARGEGGYSKYAAGGPILGGSGIRDDVPILAMGGEFIINKEQTRKYRSLLEAINEDRLPRFARGGSVSKSEREARNAARGDLTISRFGWMAGSRRSEFQSALARPDSMRSLIDALNGWRSIIQKATHGGTERSLLRALDSTGKKLLTYQKQLDKASSSLEKSKARLDELRQAASQLRESVMNGVLGSANITRAATAEDSRVTINTIMSQMIGSRDRATAFSQALKDLQKKGLSGALLQQVAEAGVDGGGLETAGALLGASSSQLKQLNSLQSQITTAAVGAGKTTADAVYANQIKGQERLVKAWDNTVKTLGSKMDKLAAAMEKAIERGFGMRRAAGGIIGAASGGARGSWTLVGEHEPELVRLPFGSRVYSGPDTRRMQQAAWTSMLNTPQRGSGRRYVGTPAGAPMRPVVVHQTINLDGRVVAQQIFDPLRGEIRARGGDVQQTLGQGQYRDSTGGTVRPGG